MSYDELLSGYVDEWWSIGACSTPIIHYSITPILQYSITPILHYSIAPTPSSNRRLTVPKSRGWSDWSGSASDTTTSRVNEPISRCVDNMTASGSNGSLGGAVRVTCSRYEPGRTSSTTKLPSGLRPK